MVSVYVHTGEAETPRQEEKYRFLDAMTPADEELADGGRRVVVAGDLNIAHTRGRPEQLEGQPRQGGVPAGGAGLPRPLARVGRVGRRARRAAGDVDGPYTWWSWRGKAFDNDTGWRIDYQLAVGGARRRPCGTWVGRAATYAERWSDHAAVVADYDYRPHRRPRRSGGTGQTGPMTETKPVECWLTDMDGVLVHEEHAIPGARRVHRGADRDPGAQFLVLTNNSIFTPRDLRARLLTSGIDIPEASIWTSALATAQFLDDQRPGGTAYVIGEAGLTTALHDVGYVLTEPRPRLRRAGRDPHLLVRGHHQGDPADRGRRAVHRDQPRPDRAVRRGAAAGDRLGRGAHHQGDRRRALLRRQAQPADDAQRAEPDRRPLRDHGDDRRPHGHRHHQRAGGRPAHDPGADRLDRRPARSTGSRTGRRGSWTPSPTSCRSIAELDPAR